MDSYLSIRRIGARGNIDAAAHAAGGQPVTAQHQEGRLAIEHVLIQRGVCGTYPNIMRFYGARIRSDWSWG